MQIKLQSYQRLAEAYRKTEDFEQAIESLQRIIELVPNGIMVPETMLKLAHFQLEQESQDSHIYKNLRQLVEKYPGTREGQEASELLEQFE